MKSCNKCGGIIATENLEVIAGRICECPVEPGVICPICKTDKLEDISPRQNNGVFGSGFASWKIVELRKCPNCKIVIVP